MNLKICWKNLKNMKKKITPCYFYLNWIWIYISWLNHLILNIWVSRAKLGIKWYYGATGSPVEDAKNLCSNNFFNCLTRNMILIQLHKCLQNVSNNFHWVLVSIMEYITYFGELLTSNNPLHPLSSRGPSFLFTFLSLLSLAIHWYKV